MRYFQFVCFALLFFTQEIYAQDIDLPTQSNEFAVITFDKNPKPHRGYDFNYCWSKSEYSFGEVKAGEIVSHVYEFKNTGKVPLVITEAKASCGCTVPTYSEEPIMPGEMGELKVVFDTKGKKGKQSKRITIYANTDPTMTFVTIRGIVNFEKETSSEEHDLKTNCFAIYPNPTSETLQLKLKEHFGKSALVEIHNETGKKVITKNIDSISNETTRFDVSNLPTGHYYISIFLSNSKPITQCFVVLNK